MKKKGIIACLVCCLAFSLMGCSKKMTLNLSYGDRVGKYSGELSEDGIPNGKGKFVSTSENGEKWTYEGDFKDGHFDGEGKTTWENGQVEIGTYKDDVIVPLKGDETKSLYTTPENLKNHYVELIGTVFMAPEYMDDGVCVQMMSDIKNHDNNTVVYIHDKDFKVKQNDYLHVVGLVGGTVTGQNALGNAVSAPTITAKEYEIYSYKDAVAPALKTIEVNQTQSQLGYSVTVQQVEYAENETRVYLKVDNHGSDKFNVYSFYTKITQDGKQYSEQNNWEADYPAVQTDLLVGNSSEGVIVFPAINEGAFTLTVEGSSNNFWEDLKPYTFDIQ